MKPKALFESLGGKSKAGHSGEDPKSLPQSLTSSGGGSKKYKGKGIHINGMDDVKTTVHIPSAGQMKKKVEAQVKGQKKSKGYSNG